MANGRAAETGLLWRCAWLCALVGMTWLSGCSAAPPTPEAPPKAATEPDLAPSPPPLDEEELAARDRLARFEGVLARAVPRGRKFAWEMADAADALATEIEALGYPVVRQAYEVDAATFFNISVRSYGTTNRDEVLVVGAPYDAETGASVFPAALLLELAHALRTREHERSVDVVWFALGQGTDVAEAERGVAHYLSREAARRAKLEELLKDDAAMRARGELIEGTPELDVDRSRPVLFLSLGGLAEFSTKRRVSSTASKSGSADASAGTSGHVDEALSALSRELGYLEFGALHTEPDADSFTGAGIPSVTLAAVAPTGHRKAQEAPSDLEARLAVRLTRAVLEIAGQPNQLDNLYLKE